MTNSEIRSQERRYQTEKIKFKNAETQDIFFASVSVAIVKVAIVDVESFCSDFVSPIILYIQVDIGLS